jgi:hypothetical protein
MTDAEVVKVYSEYQRRYTSCVSDDVVNNVLYGYAAFCQWLAPETEKEKLAKELREIKKLLGHFGMALSLWLAVVNAAVITAKNVNLVERNEPDQEPPMCVHESATISSDLN